MFCRFWCRDFKVGENSKSACISGVVQITANFKDFQRKNLFKILNQLIDRCTDDGRDQNRMVQTGLFGKGVRIMTSIGRNQYIKSISPLDRLDLFIAEEWVVRVGGRLKRYTYNENLLYLIALPKDVIISKRVLE